MITQLLILLLLFIIVTTVIVTIIVCTIDELMGRIRKKRFRKECKKYYGIDIGKIIDEELRKELDK